MGRITRKLPCDRTEDQLQAEFWERCWNEFPQARRCMWAVPNGENRHPAEAARMKALGLLPGVWDLHLFWKGQFHIIEAKVGSNGLTVDRVAKGRKIYGQKEWGEIMALHGAHRHIFRTVEEGVGIFAQIVGK